ncbi:MAG: hypothetical protein Q9165_006347 [Trypethelium subeluteriae]
MALKITPIAYEEGFPFPYNNFVYAVDLNTEDHHIDHHQPGTHDVPSGTSSVVIRLPNPISGYNNKGRVENEVAALSLARHALQSRLAHLVPRVFAWCSARDGQGWILQERMAGQPLHEDFQGMSQEQRSKILEQMADILAHFQRYKIPDSVKGYGGLTFNAAGEYVSAPLSILDGGPFPTYEALVKKTIESKLAKSDIDPRVQATDNLLYDKDTLQLTAVVDFDFAHIATVADEFFRSLGHDIGRFPDVRSDNEEQDALRNAMLNGFPKNLPVRSEEVSWTAAKAWDDALRNRDMARPSTIRNITQLADLFWLSSAILPFKLCNEVVVGNSSSEQLLKRKEIGTSQLQKFLEDYGF